MKRILSLLLVSFALIFSPKCGFCNQQWEIVPAVHRVNALVNIDGNIWGATNSGLFCFDPVSETFQIFSTVDGLSSVEIDAMAADERGNLILGMGNANIDIFNLQSRRVIEKIVDFKNNNEIFAIYKLYYHEGEIFVCTDIGVSRLVYFEDVKKYLIAGNYIKLGDFSPEIATRDVCVYENGLWVATEAGLARGDLSQQFLEASENWTNFTTAQGLSSNEVTALEVFRDTLYVNVTGTSLGLNRLLSLSQGFETLQVGYSNNANSMKAHQDTLYVCRRNGVFRLDGGSLVKYGGLSAGALCLTFLQDGSMWAGMQTYRADPQKTILGGLKNWDGGEWKPYAPDGALVEVVDDVLVDDTGSVWVAGALDIGMDNGNLCHFDGDRWVNLGRQSEDYLNNTAVSPDSFFFYRTRTITQDLSGSVWAGSDGRGVGWFKFDGDTVLARGFYSAVTGHLFNIEPGENFCVVRDLCSDSDGNVWICNSEADPKLSDGKPIAIVPADFIRDSDLFPNWTYMGMSDESGNPLLIDQYYVDRVGIDSYGRKWFGGNNAIGNDKGVMILSDNGTPLTEYDDQWTNILSVPSDFITAIVTDGDGVVWIGTPSGVKYFYPHENPDLIENYGFHLYDLPVGGNVRCIAVDPQNNKWFGTTEGVSILASDNYTWLDSYTVWDGAYPSPLPGETVQAIDFDPRTGVAYIGTDRGVACLTTPYKQMGESVTDVSIITDSNPFIIGGGQNARLYFDAGGLSETAKMKIFTTTGLLVRILNKNEIIQGWDGRNDRGEFVGTGVYLLLAYDPDGNAEVGKVAVIHR